MLKGHAQRFLNAHRQYRDWTLQYVAIAPEIDPDIRRAVQAAGAIPQDLTDLAKGL